MSRHLINKVTALTEEEEEEEEEDDTWPEISEFIFNIVDKKTCLN